MRFARHLPWVVRIALAIVFLWAGWAKLIDPSRFFGALLGYDLPISESVLRFIAVTLPWLECLCGAALLVNVWPETVRPLTLFLGGLFVALLSQALLRGLNVDCGCFGGSSHAWFNQPLIAWLRAIALTIGALYLWLDGTKRPERMESCLSDTSKS